jgi:hypothetical protein
MQQANNQRSRIGHLEWPSSSSTVAAPFSVDCGSRKIQAESNRELRPEYIYSRGSRQRSQRRVVRSVRSCAVQRRAVRCSVAEQYRAAQSIAQWNRCGIDVESLCIRCAIPAKLQRHRCVSVLRSFCNRCAVVTHGCCFAAHSRHNCRKLAEKSCTLSAKSVCERYALAVHSLRICWVSLCIRCRIAGRYARGCSHSVASGPLKSGGRLSYDRFSMIR